MAPPQLAAGATRADDFGRLVDALLRPTALVELAVFAGCLVLAWSSVRLLRGPDPRPQSIWFGEGVVGGALFPVVALLLAWLARWILTQPWVGMPIAVFLVVVPILTSLVVIRLTVRVLRRALPQSNFVRVVERSISWVAWGLVVLWITGLLPLMLQELDKITWAIGGSQVSVRNVLEALVSAVVVLMGALWLSSTLESLLVRGAGDNLSLRKMAASALRAGLLVLGLMLALSAAGIDLTALSVLGGALGVGIGLGLQKLAANYVSGFVILAERSMRIGDTVKVDNFEGRITDISTRYTVIRALNGRESIVPNEMMITQRVENTTLADTRVLISSSVQVAYGTDLDVLLPRLCQTIAAVSRVLAAPGPAVQLTNFAADGLDLTLNFWITDPENGQGNVRSEVNLAVLRLLNQTGVQIPFPQRVLHAAAAG
jgi:small-conductance mechanosensitive channel